jgi:tetratricopeptide (TPR) repeat protein
MSQTNLAPQWLKMLSDPYAVLGIPVAADEHRIIKRYYFLAKLLHSEDYGSQKNEDKHLAQVILKDLINPAYERLKKLDSRTSNLAMLNLEASYFNLEDTNLINNPYAQQMTQMSALEADFFYQQAVNSYSPSQYESLGKAYQVTQNLSTLNLVYLKIQANQLVTDKIFSPEIATSSQLSPQELSQENSNFVLKVDSTETVEIKPEIKPVGQNYAQRHYQRAIIYTKQAKWSEAVIELRDAIKLEPKNSDFHALLGLVHYKQNLLGMARVYTRQALKLNAKQALALKYAAILGMQEDMKILPSSVAKTVGIAGFLRWFSPKKE